MARLVSVTVAALLLSVTAVFVAVLSVAFVRVTLPPVMPEMLIPAPVRVPAVAPTSGSVPLAIV